MNQNRTPRPLLRRATCPCTPISRELPVHTNASCGRGAPSSQAFTRKRIALGGGHRSGGKRQPRVDLRSVRRWFIRKAMVAPGDGVAIFRQRIADVVGHSKTGNPLAMTMGRYPGRAYLTALRTCLEAVKLPNVRGEAGAHADLAEAVLLVPANRGADLPNLSRYTSGMMTTRAGTRIGSAAPCSLPC